jgi:L-fuconolactonase
MFKPPEPFEMPNFPIVDAHIHLFDRSKVSYEWIGKNWPEIDRPHHMSDFDKARGNIAVDKLIYCELLPDPGFQFAEVEYIEARAKEDPRLVAMTASAPIELGAAIEENAEKLAAHSIVRGIRYHVPKNAPLSFGKTLIDAVKVLGRHNLHVELGANAQGLAEAIEVARLCPEVPMVLCHMGMTRGAPDVPRGIFEPWRQQIEILSELDNVVAVKVSGTASVVGRDWVASDVRPFLEYLIETFGTKRCMYASDWPASSFAHAYGDWVELIDQVMAGASEQEKQDLYRNTALRVFRVS